MKRIALALCLLAAACTHNPERALRKQVDALYAEGRNTVMGDEELEVMVRRADTERYEHLLFHKSR